MFGVEFDLRDLDRAFSPLFAPSYREVGKGMDESGAIAANTWESAASGVRLPGMTRTVNWPGYARTVEHHLRGELEVVVAGNQGMTEKATSERPARDMKPAILNGPHSRPTRDGSRYNRIPFRHNAESVSDAAMMALIANARNFRTNLGQRSKLNIPVAPGHSTRTTGPGSGLRMTDGGPMTWRTVSSGSDPASWWYPALPANPLVSSVWEQVKDEIAEPIFRAWLRAFGLD